VRNQNKNLYEEAVTRNLTNAEKKPTKYVGKELVKAKTMLGIRNVDDYWDVRVTKLCKSKI
jgi:hypothetical protein